MIPLEAIDIVYPFQHLYMQNELVDVLSHFHLDTNNKSDFIQDLEKFSQLKLKKNTLYDKGITEILNKAENLISQHIQIIESNRNNPASQNLTDIFRSEEELSFMISCLVKIAQNFDFRQEKLLTIAAAIIDLLEKSSSLVLKVQCYNFLRAKNYSNNSPQLKEKFYRLLLLSWTYSVGFNLMEENSQELHLFFQDDNRYRELLMKKKIEISGNEKKTYQPFMNLDFYLSSRLTSSMFMKGEKYDEVIANPKHICLGPINLSEFDKNWSAYQIAVHILKENKIDHETPCQLLDALTHKILLYRDISNIESRKYGALLSYYGMNYLITQAGKKKFENDISKLKIYCTQNTGEKLTSELEDLFFLEMDPNIHMFLLSMLSPPVLENNDDQDMLMWITQISNSIVQKLLKDIADPEVSIFLPISSSRCPQMQLEILKVVKCILHNSIHREVANNYQLSGIITSLIIMLENITQQKCEYSDQCIELLLSNLKGILLDQELSRDFNLVPKILELAEIKIQEFVTILKNENKDNFEYKSRIIFKIIQLIDKPFIFAQNRVQQTNLVVLSRKVLDSQIPKLYLELLESTCPEYIFGRLSLLMLDLFVHVATPDNSLERYNDEKMFQSLLIKAQSYFHYKIKLMTMIVSLISKMSTKDWGFQFERKLNVLDKILFQLCSQDLVQIIWNKNHSAKLAEEIIILTNNQVKYKTIVLNTIENIINELSLLQKNYQMMIFNQLEKNEIDNCANIIVQSSSIKWVVECNLQSDSKKFSKMILNFVIFLSKFFQEGKTDLGGKLFDAKILHKLLGMLHYNFTYQIESTKKKPLVINAALKEIAHNHEKENILFEIMNWVLQELLNKQTTVIKGMVENIDITQNLVSFLKDQEVLTCEDKLEAMFMYHKKTGNKPSPHMLQLVNDLSYIMILDEFLRIILDVDQLQNYMELHYIFNDKSLKLLGSTLKNNIQIIKHLINTSSLLLQNKTGSQNENDKTFVEELFLDGEGSIIDLEIQFVSSMKKTYSKLCSFNPIILPTIAESLSTLANELNLTNNLIQEAEDVFILKNIKILTIIDVVLTKKIEVKHISFLIAFQYADFFKNLLKIIPQLFSCLEKLKNYEKLSQHPTQQDKINFAKFMFIRDGIKSGNKLFTAFFNKPLSFNPSSLKNFLFDKQNSATPDIVVKDNELVEIGNGSIILIIQLIQQLIESSDPKIWNDVAFPELQLDMLDMLLSNVQTIEIDSHKFAEKSNEFLEHQFNPPGGPPGIDGIVQDLHNQGFYYSHEQVRDAISKFRRPSLNDLLNYFLDKQIIPLGKAKPVEAKPLKEQASPLKNMFKISTEEFKKKRSEIQASLGIYLIKNIYKFSNYPKPITNFLLKFAETNKNYSSEMTDLLITNLSNYFYENNFTSNKPLPGSTLMKRNSKKLLGNIKIEPNIEWNALKEVGCLKVFNLMTPIIIELINPKNKKLANEMTQQFPKNFFSDIVNVFGKFIKTFETNFITNLNKYSPDIKSFITNIFKLFILIKDQTVTLKKSQSQVLPSSSPRKIIDIANPNLHTEGPVLLNQPEILLSKKTSVDKMIISTNTQKNVQPGSKDFDQLQKQKSSSTAIQKVLYSTINFMKLHNRLALKDSEHELIDEKSLLSLFNLLTIYFEKSSENAQYFIENNGLQELLNLRVSQSIMPRPEECWKVFDSILKEKSIIEACAEAEIKNYIYRATVSANTIKENKILESDIFLKKCTPLAKGIPNFQDLVNKLVIGEKVPNAPTAPKNAAVKTRLKLLAGADFARFDLQDESKFEKNSMFYLLNKYDKKNMDEKIVENKFMIFYKPSSHINKFIQALLQRLVHFINPKTDSLENEESKNSKSSTLVSIKNIITLFGYLCKQYPILIPQILLTQIQKQTFFDWLTHGNCVKMAFIPEVQQIYDFFFIENYLLMKNYQSEIVSFSTLLRRSFFLELNTKFQSIQLSINDYSNISQLASLSLIILRALKSYSLSKQISSTSKNSWVLQIYNSISNLIKNISLENLYTQQDQLELLVSPLTALNLVNVLFSINKSRLHLFEARSIRDFANQEKNFKFGVPACLNYNYMSPQLERINEITGIILRTSDFTLDRIQRPFISCSQNSRPMLFESDFEIYERISSFALPRGLRYREEQIEVDDEEYLENNSNEMSPSNAHQENLIDTFEDQLHYENENNNLAQNNNEYIEEENDTSNNDPRDNLDVNNEEYFQEFEENEFETENIIRPPSNDLDMRHLSNVLKDTNNSKIAYPPLSIYGSSLISDLKFFNHNTLAYLIDASQKKINEITEYWKTKNDDYANKILKFIHALNNEPEVMNKGISDVMLDTRNRDLMLLDRDIFSFERDSLSGERDPFSFIRSHHSRGLDHPMELMREFEYLFRARNRYNGLDYNIPDAALQNDIRINVQGQQENNPSLPNNPSQTNNINSSPNTRASISNLTRQFFEFAGSLNPPTTNLESANLQRSRVQQAVENIMEQININDLNPILQNNINNPQNVENIASPLTNATNNLPVINTSPQVIPPIINNSLPTTNPIIQPQDSANQSLPLEHQSNLVAQEINADKTVENKNILNTQNEIKNLNTSITNTAQVPSFGENNEKILNEENKEIENNNSVDINTSANQSPTQNLVNKEPTQLENTLINSDLQQNVMPEENKEIQKTSADSNLSQNVVVEENKESSDPVRTSTFDFRALGLPEDFLQRAGVDELFFDSLPEDLKMDIINEYLPELINQGLYSNSPPANQTTSNQLGSNEIPLNSTNPQNNSGTSNVEPNNNQNRQSSTAANINNSNINENRTNPPATNNNSANIINELDLNDFPEDIRNEILQQMSRPTTTVNEDPVNELLILLASLPQDAREDVLLTVDENRLNQLPPEIQNEAREYQHQAQRRHYNNRNSYLGLGELNQRYGNLIGNIEQSSHQHQLSQLLENRQTKSLFYKLHQADDKLIEKLLGLLFVGSSLKHFPLSLIVTLCFNPINEVKIVDALVYILAHLKDYDKWETKNFPPKINVFDGMKIMSKNEYISLLSLKILIILEKITVDHCNYFVNRSSVQETKIESKFVKEKQNLLNKSLGCIEELKKISEEMDQTSAFGQIISLLDTDEIKVSPLKIILLTKILNNIIEKSSLTKEKKSESTINFSSQNVAILCKVLSFQNANERVISILSSIISNLSHHEQNIELVIEELNKIIFIICKNLNKKFSTCLEILHGETATARKLSNDGIEREVLNQMIDDMNEESKFQKVFTIYTQLFEKMLTDRNKQELAKEEMIEKANQKGEEEEEKDVASKKGKQQAEKAVPKMSFCKNFEDIKLEVKKIFEGILNHEHVRILWLTMSELLYLLSEKFENNSKILNPIIQKNQPLIQSFFLFYKILSDDNSIEKLKKQITKTKINDNKKKVSSIADIANKTFEKTIVDKKFNQLREQSLTVDEIFLIMCEKNKRILNYLIRQNPKLITDDAFSIILKKLPHIIDFDNKREYFKASIKLMKEGRMPTLKLVIRRKDIFTDSYNQLSGKSIAEMKGKIHIEFKGEEGADVGGLSREWFLQLSKQIFFPGYALFKPSANGNTFQPDSKSYVNPDHLKFFKFVGRFIGKALMEGQLLDTFFTRSFYKHMTGTALDFQDLEDLDPDLHKNLEWMLKNDMTNMGIYFSYDHDNFGKVEERDLIPKGRQIEVTNENKLEYVQKLAYAKMAIEIKSQIESFLEGLHDLVPQELLSIFTPRELELMISGLPDIDFDDLKENTEYHTYSKDSTIIQWFWEIVTRFDIQMKANFLQFVTGTSKVPLEGFSALRGMNNQVQKFQIHKAYDTNLLPTTHTCFNQLDLPEYPTQDILAEKLVTAIIYGKEGFGFI